MNFLGRLRNMFTHHDREKHDLLNELAVVKGRSQLANRRADNIAKEARRRSLQLQLEVMQRQPPQR
jgi:hypothetical protein